MATKENVTSVREAVGIFFDAQDLQEAVADLLRSGFNQTQIGLLASEGTVQEALGDFYDRTNRSMHDKNGPVTAFVKKESVGDTVHSIVGGLIFAGTTVAGGAVVASAAIMGGALAGVVAGAVGVGAVGALMGLIIHQSDAEYLEEQVDAGHLLLFVRLLNREQEALALQILTRHSSYDPKIHELLPQKKGSAHVVGASTV